MTIKASKCSQCGRFVIPPREICPYCRSTGSDILTVQVSSRGIIDSYTVLHMPPEGFTPPLLLALVRLEVGASILCLGETDISDSVAIGTPVSVEADEEERFRFKTI